MSTDEMYTENARYTPIREFGVLAAITLLAAALRLIRLGSFAFWADEVHNLLLSNDLYATFIEGKLVANHPPLPYFLLAFWRWVGMGGSEWTLRGLPALFGVLGVVAFYFLARELFGVRVARFAALILAVAPFHVVHSQDLKEYIYLPFVVSVTAIYFYRGMTHNRWKDWLIYGLLACACCYTETFVAPLLTTLNLWYLAVFYKTPERLKRWFFGNFLGALLFMPWLGLMLRKVHTYMISAEHWWVPWPSLWSVVFYFKTVAHGYTAIKPFFYLATLLFAVLLAAGVYYAWQRNRNAAVMLVLWAVVPPAMVYGMSFIAQSIFLIRALIPYSLAIYLLVGVALASIKPSRLGRVALAITLTLSAIGLFAHYARIFPPTQFPHRPGIHPPRDYDKAAHYILEHFEEGDVVIHGSQSTWFPFHWYGFKGRAHHAGGMNAEFVRVIRSGDPVHTDDEDLLQLWAVLIDGLVADHKRVWFVFSEWDRSLLTGNAAAIWRWLDSRYVEVEQTPFEGIDVLLYLTSAHENTPRPLRRDQDDGVSALVHYSDREEPYRKIIPDDGVVQRTPEQRQGNLTLRFTDMEDSVAADGARAISFVVENRAGYAASCDIRYIASAALTPIAAFDRINPESNTWHVGKLYNSEPPPEAYDLPIMSGDLQHGADHLRGEVTLPPGQYVPYCFSATPWNRQEFWLAPVSITLGTSPFAETNEQTWDSPGWRWARGATIHVTDDAPIPVTIEAHPLPGQPPGYANLAYLAFVAPEHEPVDARTMNEYPPWPGRVEIPAGASLDWQVRVAQGVGRVDIWVFEHDIDGRAYYIYTIFDTP